MAVDVDNTTLDALGLAIVAPGALSALLTTRDSRRTSSVVLSTGEPGPGVFARPSAVSWAATATATAATAAPARITPDEFRAERWS
jgi:hypothetical protein